MNCANFMGSGGAARVKKLSTVTSLLVYVMLIGSAEIMAAEFALPVVRHELANGMVVLTLEDHSVPVTTFYAFYRVGSRNERPGITGLSHFFEHMMFNGASKYGPKMFDKTLESAGGYSNAWTSNDITAYFEDFASDQVERIDSE